MRQATQPRRSSRSLFSCTWRTFPSNRDDTRTGRYPLPYGRGSVGVAEWVIGSSLEAEVLEHGVANGSAVQGRARRLALLRLFKLLFFLLLALFLEGGDLSDNRGATCKVRGVRCFDVYFGR